MTDLNTYWIHPDSMKVILDSLSRGIVQYEHKEAHTLDQYIQVYEDLHETIDKRFPDWLTTNAEVKRIIEDFRKS